MQTTNGIEITSTTPERAAEIVNIINTYEILEKATDTAANDPSADFAACYRAQWTYYNNNYEILCKIGDAL